MNILLGQYLSLKIVKERGLVSVNPAGSNRMLRLANAIAESGNGSGKIIVSPASSARIGFNKRIIHPAKIERSNNVVIIYATALSIPYLSILFEIISITTLLLFLFKRKTIKTVTLYCYYPSTIFGGIAAKICGAKIIEDLEDVVTPKWTDIFKTSFLFTLQQLFGVFLMHISIAISNLIIIPSARFKKMVNIEKKSVIIVDGCIETNDNIQSQNLTQNKVKVLMAGLLDDDQGLGLFLELLRNLNTDPILNKDFEFHITGMCQTEVMVKQEISKLNNLKIYYHGFVETAEYQSILHQSNICLVLQDPNGRYSNTKTPSKGYEYIASGKAVIISDVGDFGYLPHQVCIVMNEYSVNYLRQILNDITIEEINRISYNALSYAANNWDYSSVGKKIQNGLTSPNQTSIKIN